jgi:hypothetical protein
MSNIAFDGSPAWAFIASPAHARNKSKTLVPSFKWCISTFVQYGFLPFDKPSYNSTLDRYLRLEAVTTSDGGETQTFIHTIDRITGDQLDEGPIYSTDEETYLASFSDATASLTVTSVTPTVRTTVGKALDSHITSTMVETLSELNTIQSCMDTAAGNLERVVSDFENAEYATGTGITNDGNVIAATWPGRVLSDGIFQYLIGPIGLTGQGGGLNPAERAFYFFNFSPFGTENAELQSGHFYVKIQRVKYILHAPVCRITTKRNFISLPNTDNDTCNFSQTILESNIHPFASQQQSGLMELTILEPARSGFDEWAVSVFQKTDTEGWNSGSPIPAACGI